MLTCRGKWLMTVLKPQIFKHPGEETHIHVTLSNFNYRLIKIKCHTRTLTSTPCPVTPYYSV